MNDVTPTIGQVARRAGLRTSAIRYYESVGVLPEPERVSGQRRYTTETVRRLHVIDVAKHAGFTLYETPALLATRDAAEPLAGPLRELARHKLREVDALIARATAIREWLTAATGCDCGSLDACALFAGDRGA